MSESSVSYNLTCYTGCDVYKWKHDVSRDDVPYQYCKGKNGFDKNMSLDDVIEIIAKPKGANLIIKSGPRAKWYVKKVSPDEARRTITHRKKDYIEIKNSKCYVVEW